MMRFGFGWGLLCLLAIVACEETRSGQDASPEPDGAVSADASLDAQVQLDAAGVVDAAHDAVTSDAGGRDASAVDDAGLDAIVVDDAGLDAALLDDAGLDAGLDASIDAALDANVDDCLTDNGGCDPLVTCTDEPLGVTCGACPDGLGGDGEADCLAQLTDLTVSVGTLVPAFAPGHTSYRVGVDLTVETIDLTAHVPAGVSLWIDGAQVSAATPWTTPTLALGLNEIALTLRLPDHSDRVVTVHITRGAQTAYIKAEDPDLDDWFGQRVALSGDTLAIVPLLDDSASNDPYDNSATSAGAVYVFVRDGETWQQQAYLKASAVDAQDLFGQSVALDGDVLVVGATGEDSDASGVNGDATNDSLADSGAAYVFRRNGTTWTQEAYLKASNPGTSDNFGARVAIDGDTIVIGAQNERSNATGVNNDQNNDLASGSGAAYVFTRVASVWSQQAYLKASNTGAGDAFGYALAISANTLAVGAHFEDTSLGGVNVASNNGALSSGAVYMFTRSGTTWSQQAFIKSAYPQPDAYFGVDLALAGDTLVVGASGESSPASGVGGNQNATGAGSSGAVFIFDRSAGTWAQSAYLKAGNSEAGDAFGYAVAFDGTRVVVGAPFEDSNNVSISTSVANNTSTDSGAAYVFGRTAGIWSQRYVLKASNAGSFDQLGMGVAVIPGVIAVGATREASAIGGNQRDPLNNTLPSGAVYVFH